MLKLLVMFPLVPSLVSESLQPAFPALAGFKPQSDVRQHARIDLDQRDFQTFLSKGDFSKASDIYVNGGNSLKTVRVALSEAVGRDYPRYSRVEQGRGARGVLGSSASRGDMDIKVSLTSPCAGQFAAQSQPDNCFSTENLVTASISVSGDTYKVGEVTSPYRNLAGFSLAPESKMKGQRMFEMYRSYFGAPDYADKFVKAALRGDDETKRVSDKVPFKFSDKPAIYRVECAQKGSAYWGLWMYVIRELEDGVSDCAAGCATNSCNDGPVHAWDEAAAFYVGSIEGEAGDSDGRLLYRLAEKRCKNFNTCACRGEAACTNKRVLAKLSQGRDLLASGRCEEAKVVKEQLISLLTIPLVQGTLRYARKIGYEAVGPKERAEGVAFAGAILPQVAACGQEARLRQNMWIDTDRKGPQVWTEVKGAIMDSVACLNMTLEDLGINNLEAANTNNGEIPILRSFALLISFTLLLIL